MHKYILKRVLMLIPIILGVSFLVFFMMEGASGNALEIIGIDYSEEKLAELYHKYGYDRSVFYRYFLYMSNLLKGSLGNSIIYKKDVWTLYMQRLPATLQLASASVLLAVILSIPLGIVSARKHGSLVDNASMVGALVGLSMPNYWLGLMLAVLFAQKLHWLPSSGDLNGIWSLILPAITVGTGLMATMTRTTRSSMLDVIRQDYLRTARAKGVPEKTVINRHAFRNTFIPLVTMLGGTLPGLFSGALITETLFSIRGIGYASYTSMTQADIPFIMFYLTFISILTLLGNLISDLLYAAVDPRVRLS